MCKKKKQQDKEQVKNYHFKQATKVELPIIGRGNTTALKTNILKRGTNF
jgi:hypothetical protein